MKQMFEIPSRDIPAYITYKEISNPLLFLSKQNSLCHLWHSIPKEQADMFLVSNKSDLCIDYVKRFCLFPNPWDYTDFLIFIHEIRLNHHMFILVLLHTRIATYVLYPRNKWKQISTYLPVIYGIMYSAISF